VTTSAYVTGGVGDVWRTGLGTQWSLYAWQSVTVRGLRVPRLLQC